MKRYELRRNFWLLNGSTRRGEQAFQNADKPHWNGTKMDCG